LVLHEARELFALLDAELGLEDDPASLFERGLLTALHHLQGHALLRRVLRDEPEAILPFLTVRAAPLLESAVEFMAPYVERAVKTERITPVDPRAAAEWAARVLLSLLLTPSVVVDLDDPQQLKGFVRWIIRGIPRQGETS
jgi:AcrR family transcriptional regulator